MTGADVEVHSLPLYHCAQLHCFLTPGIYAFIVVDDASVDGGAEVLTVSSAGSSTSIPVANTPLRPTHAAGATVQTATLAPLGPMT